MRSAFRATLFLTVSLFQVCAHAGPPDNLFAAIKSKDLTALAIMVERGADVNARNDAGQTPLMTAATTEYGGEKLIDMLVNQGADIRARDNKGMTALMHAAGKGVLENAEQLLQLGIDPDIKDNSGKTVTDYAMAGGLDNDRGGRPSFVSMLMGNNHTSEGTPAYTFYISYKPGTIGAKEFEQAAIRALTRKDWGIVETSGTVARAFYARTKLGRLYKAEVILEPARIAIRFRPGFGFHGDRAYLESIRSGLMRELGLY